ncbi:hypothetical protein [Mycobacterium sp. 1081908.1]|uniref:hypothetical protein n=1 Tax=Mycobacterium sp. 1081908.1 TaxID=1834066 RepID=UPI0012EA9108|nr:hypothetical protein [Mycobacterium sp. 1081908.1]
MISPPAAPVITRQREVVDSGTDEQVIGIVSSGMSCLRLRPELELMSRAERSSEIPTAQIGRGRLID